MKTCPMRLYKQEIISKNHPQNQTKFPTMKIFIHTFVAYYLYELQEKIILQTKGADWCFSACKSN